MATANRSRAKAPTRKMGTVNADGSPEKLYAVYESGLGWKKA